MALQKAFWQRRTEAIYKEFCAFQGLTPVVPCPWTLSQAMAYRRGQRARDRLDRAARLASKYFPLDQEIPVPPPPSNEAIYERLLELERDIEGLLSHRHHGSGVARSQQGVKSVLDIGSDGRS